MLTKTQSRHLKLLAGKYASDCYEHARVAYHPTPTAIGLANRHEARKKSNDNLVDYIDSLTEK